MAFLSSHATGLAWATVFSRTLLWAGPVLLGFLPPTTDRSYFLSFMLDHLVLYGVSLVIVLMLLFRALSLWRVVLRRLRASVTSGAPGDVPLVVLALAVLVGYLCTGWGGEQWSGSEPRYLLPLYSAVPLVIRLGLPLKPAAWQCVIAWLIVLGIAGADLAVNTTTFGRTDETPLATLLESHGVRAVYGDYWLVYPLMFASKERVIGVAVDDELGKGELENRYSPYLRIAAATVIVCLDRRRRKCAREECSAVPGATWQPVHATHVAERDHLCSPERARIPMVERRPLPDGYLAPTNAVGRKRSADHVSSMAMLVTGRQPVGSRACQHSSRLRFGNQCASLLRKGDPQHAAVTCRAECGGCCGDKLVAIDGEQEHPIVLDVRTRGTICGLDSCRKRSQAFRNIDAQRPHSRLQQ